MSSGRLPNFLILGAMRSGSTSLYRYLGAHPDIHLVPKELGFFTDQFDKGLDWYRDQFSGHGETLLGEATADYFARRSAMRRIVTTLPDAKLIASLRNPVQRAFSHYGLLSTRGVDRRSFETAIDEELALVSRNGPDAEGVFYLSHGIYDLHLERWLEHVSPSQLHLVVFDQIKARPYALYRELCDFLGVDPTFVPDLLGESVNAFVTFRSLKVRSMTKRMPEPIGRAVARLNTRQHAQQPQMSDATREKLVEFYQPRIGRVESMSGLDLSHWNRR